MRKSNVKTNTLYNTIKTLFGILYPLITFPYISRVLMAENVGKINFANSVVSYFSLIASLGVTTYAIRECAKVRGDQEKLNQTASQILSINLVSTLAAYLALGVTLIVARPLDHYRILICIQSSTLLFTTLGADWLNTAMEDFRYVTVRTISFQLLSLLLMLLLVKQPGDYVRYALISVLASSGANVVNIFYRRKFCRTWLTLHLDLKRHLPPILLLFTVTFAQIIYTNSDTTILGLFRGDFEVGLYSVVIKIYHLVNTTIASVAWVVMPQLSANFAEKNYTEANRLLKHSLNFIIILGLPAIVGINVLAKPIIYLMAGGEYLGAAPALHIFTGTLLFSLIGGWIGNMTMLPAGREKLCLFASVVSALINIVLNLILIPSFGICAAAATTMVSEAACVLILGRKMDRAIRIDSWREMLRAPIVGSIGIVIVGIAVRLLVKSYVLAAILAVVLSVLVYGVCLIVLKNEFALDFLQPLIKKKKK